MEFEVVMLVFIDLDGIVLELMNKDEKDYLNWYYKLVYDKILFFLIDEEREWLKVYIRVI